MNTKIVHVAVAVIRDADGRVLCTQRLPHQHLAGLWEFPGGKVEAGELLADGLRREIHEELGIVTGAIAPLLRIEHRYPEKTVLLDTWRVLDWRGEPQGREGQPLRWQHPDDMRPDQFPPADVPIIAALRLPERYLISPDIADVAAADAFVARARAARASLLQLRLKTVPQLALPLLSALRAALPAARVLVNSDTLAELPVGARAEFDGVHLTAAALAALQEKPAPMTAASCHDRDELARAFSLGLDFVTLSPVQGTASHAGAATLGWENFSELAMMSGLPVYALGGMRNAQLAQAIAQGAIGIAGISGLFGD